MTGMRGKMDCFGLTDRGKKREVNDDQFLIADLCKSMLIHQTSLSHEDHSRLFGGSQGKMLVVADGFGRRHDGEKASAVAIDTLAQYVLNTMPWFLRLQENREDDFVAELTHAMSRCQDMIEMMSSGSTESFGMGATLTMSFILWPRLYVVHVGACRCYLVRHGRLEQITEDQTEAQQMLERGEITPAEASSSRWSHVLWDYLGGGAPELSPDVYKAVLNIGDALLLCTDGLTKCLHDDEILRIVNGKQSAEETCRMLVDKVNHLGGPDNVTVVVARFLDRGEAVEETRAVAAVAEPLPAEPALPEEPEFLPTA
ncbi:MAG TPA: protein phosphatase 2C domain-containing protein [Gemmataceae bacterium]|nr:protein phosphatase 2C domain-containing protein [Gemmataceae bacterium]